MKKISLLFILLACAYLTHAQAPDSINYQAIARNAAGVELSNKTISVKFIIHQGTPTGTIKLIDVHNSVTTNVFGLFTTYIGSGTGNLSTLNFSTIGNIFLEVDIDTAGTATNWISMGTTQFVSVPFAMYAKYSISGVQGPPGLLQNGDTAGQTPFWNGSNWIINSNIYNNGANIGIGTATPSSRLQINGTTTTNSLVTNALQFTNSPAAGYILRSDAAGNGTWVSPLTLVGGWWQLAPNNKDITNRNVGLGGNVIIGKTIPPAGTQNLQVYDTTKSGAALFQSFPGDPKTTVEISGDTSYALNVYNAPTGHYPALNVYSQGSGPAIYAYPGGSGMAGFFASGPGGSTSDILYVQNSAKGPGCYMVNINAHNVNSTLDAENFGLGTAGYFRIFDDSSINNNPAVYASTNGSGPQIEAQDVAASTGPGVASYISGSGRAGDFEISNPANGSPVIYVGNAGSSNGVEVSLSNNASAVYGVNGSSGTTIYGENTGSGDAAEFQISSPGSSANALFLTSNGTNATLNSMNTNTGGAATFSNGSASSPTLVTSNSGGPGSVALQVVDGGQATAKTLTSDAAGNATWHYSMPCAQVATPNTLSISSGLYEYTASKVFTLNPQENGTVIITFTGAYQYNAFYNSEADFGIYYNTTGTAPGTGTSFNPLSPTIAGTSGVLASSSMTQALPVSYSCTIAVTKGTTYYVWLGTFGINAAYSNSAGGTLNNITATAVLVNTSSGGL